MDGTNSNLNSNPNPLNSAGMEGAISPPGMGGAISPSFQSKGKVPPPLPVGGGGGEGNGRGKRRLPNPREMVAHYESQGMEKEEASLKVIDDLQNVLLNVVSSTKGGGRRGSSDSNNVVNRRLAMLEMKLDSKPGYAQTLAIGVASGVISTALSNIWHSVRRSSSSNP